MVLAVVEKGDGLAAHSGEVGFAYILHAVDDDIGSNPYFCTETVFEVFHDVKVLRASEANGDDHFVGFSGPF